MPPRLFRPSVVRRTCQAVRALHAASRINVIEELEARGFVAALTNPALREHVNSPTCIYAGVDPSASSLHVGNLLPLLGLLHFHAAGHQALAVIGGATGSIGDPSGRSTERRALSPEELDENVQGIATQVHNFFDRGIAYIEKRGAYAAVHPEQASTWTSAWGMGSRGVKVLNNYEWFKGVSFIDFLRDVGKMARVNVMLSRDSVKNRLTTDQGISFTEFSYQLLQAHDFSYLHSAHGCRVQLGGSDQWGNIVAGIDLIKRQKRAIESSAEADGNGQLPGMREGQGDDPAFGLTIPLLTTSNGEKFGKSAGNAVWLDEARTSVSDFYQFFLRSTDEDVGRYLRIFTFLPLETIHEVMAEHERAKSRRDAQKLLADEVTELVHGPIAVTRAKTVASVLFQSSSATLRACHVRDAFGSDPRLRRVRWSQVKEIPIAKLLTENGLVKSRAEANRAITSGSISLNDRKLSDPRATLERTDLLDSHLAILRFGSKNHLVLHIDD